MKDYETHGRVSPIIKPGPLKSSDAPITPSPPAHSCALTISVGLCAVYWRGGAGVSVAAAGERRAASLAGHEGRAEWHPGHRRAALVAGQRRAAGGTEGVAVRKLPAIRYGCETDLEMIELVMCVGGRLDPAAGRAGDRERGQGALPRRRVHQPQLPRQLQVPGRHLQYRQYVHLVVHIAAFLSHT